MAIVFAASHPASVSSLVLINAYASLAGDDAALVRFHTDFIRRLFAHGEGLELLAPTLVRERQAAAELIRKRCMTALPFHPRALLAHARTEVVRDTRTGSSAIAENNRGGS
jgi:pimeloyl-ACP methyl ester carboxylesterase